MPEDIAAWMTLSRVEGVGAKLFRALLSKFGSVEDVLSASPDELMTVKRLGPTLAERIVAAADQAAATQAELDELRENDVDVLTLADERYPANLRSLADAPVVLYVRGALLPDDDFAAAIVGSRECTEAGYALAADLAAALAECGVTVVSGFALGVDTAAHQGALRGRGRTLAVLGSGLGVAPPAAQRELAEWVTDRGALLSELQPHTPPSGPTLMARDRIVSGLSRGVIVIEATTDSGTMDTANRARKQQRLLWAVDWPDWEGAHSGNRALLKGGAQRLSSALDMDEIDELCSALQTWSPPSVEPNTEPQLSLF